MGCSSSAAAIRKRHQRERERSGVTLVTVRTGEAEKAKLTALGLLPGYAEEDDPEVLARAWFALLNRAAEE